MIRKNDGSAAGLVQIGGYEVLGEIARGGYGVVYRARDPKSGQEVALKVLLDLSDALELERFCREGQATARLKHPNVVRVHGVGRDEGRPYLVMDLVTGASLAKLLQRSGPLSEAEALRIVSEVTGAVQAAHSLGILHRDLKPANVLLQDGRPLLADFGLAKVAAARSLTQTGEMLGTPGYMAPEQILGDKARIGPTTDVYGLGAILYACLTGVPPFQGPTPIATLDKALRESPRPPHQLRPDLNRHLETICLRCLARDERERYPSAADLLDALEAWSAETTPTRKRPWALAALAVLALASLVGLALHQAAPAPLARGTPATSASASQRLVSPAELRRARGLLTQGREHLRRRPTQAEACFRAALAADPGLQEAQVELSLVCSTQGRPDEAQRLLEGLSLEGLGPAQRARIHFARGRVAYKGERRAQALAHFVKADELDHRAPYAAWRGIASSPMDAAQLSLARALDEHEPAVAHLLVASTLRKQEPTAAEYQAALSFADEVLGRAPDNPGLVALTALLRFRSGAHQEALRAAEELRDRWPKHVTVLHALAWIYIELGQLEPGSQASWRAKAEDTFREALRLEPRNRSLRLERARLLRLSKRYPETFAAYDALAREAPDDLDTSLQAYYAVTSWVGSAAETREVQGLGELEEIAARGHDLLARLEESPEFLHGLPFGKSELRLARVKVWLSLRTARIYGIQRKWKEADQILETLQRDPAVRAPVFGVRLMNTAERLRSSMLPDPRLAARHYQDLRRAEELGTGASLAEAVWLGASLTQPIYVGPRQVARGTKPTNLEAKLELRDAIREEWRSARVLAAWRALVELEPSNLLARVGYCEALMESREFETAVESCANAPPPLLREPHLIATWAQAVLGRGRAEDLSQVDERLSALLADAPDFDPARAARVELYLRLKRPRDAQRELQLLRGRAPRIWYQDFEDRIKFLLKFGG